MTRTGTTTRAWLGLGESIRRKYVPSAAAPLITAAVELPGTHSTNFQPTGKPGSDSNDPVSTGKLSASAVAVPSPRDTSHLRTTANRMVAARLAAVCSA